MKKPHKRNHNKGLNKRNHKMDNSIEFIVEEEMQGLG